jgi:general secretion pathway protein C
MKRWPLAATFVLFIALCVSAAYWAAQWLRPPQRPVAALPEATQLPPRLDAAAGLFGGQAAAAKQYQLRGVVVADTAGESVAVLAVDGKPARAVRVNGEVAPGVRVSEVHTQHVLLSEQGVVRRVEMPEDVKRRAKIVAADAPRRIEGGR